MELLADTGPGAPEKWHPTSDVGQCHLHLYIWYNGITMVIIPQKDGGLSMFMTLFDPHEWHIDPYRKFLWTELFDQICVTWLPHLAKASSICHQGILLPGFSAAFWRQNLNNLGSWGWASWGWLNMLNGFFVRTENFK